MDDSRSNDGLDFVTGATGRERAVLAAGRPEQAGCAADQVPFLRFARRLTVDGRGWHAAGRDNTRVHAGVIKSGSSKAIIAGNELLGMPTEAARVDVVTAALLVAYPRHPFVGE